MPYVYQPISTVYIVLDPTSDEIIRATFDEEEAKEAVNKEAHYTTIEYKNHFMANNLPFLNRKKDEDK